MHVEKNETVKDLDQFKAELIKEETIKKVIPKPLKQKIIKNCDETLILMGQLQKKQNGLNRLLEKVGDAVISDMEIMQKALVIQDIANQLIKPLTTK